jgi:hypothetical protein
VTDYVGAEDRFSNRQNPACHLLSFHRPASNLEHLGQVVEIGGNVRVIGAINLLVDCQCPPHQRLGVL